MDIVGYVDAAIPTAGAVGGDVIAADGNTAPVFYIVVVVNASIRVPRNGVAFNGDAGAVLLGVILYYPVGIIVVNNVINDEYLGTGEVRIGSGITPEIQAILT